MMRESADLARAPLGELASRISQAEQSLIHQNFELDDSAMKVEDAKIAAVKRLYEQHDRVSTWPIDLPTFGKFYAAQIPLWLGVISIAWCLLK